MAMTALLAAEIVLNPGTIVVSLVVGGLVGYFIGKAKGRAPLGAVLGAILGCVGWVIIAVIPRKRN